MGRAWASSKGSMFSWPTPAAAPPRPAEPERKACSSARRRSRVTASTFSAKTENLPLLREGSTMKRARGLPTKT